MAIELEQDNLRILIIDDNPEIHKDFIKILTRNSNQSLSSLEEKIFQEKQTEKSLMPSFCIDTVSQGKEGVQKVEKALKEHNPYALAFVDIRMPPGWNGVETIKHIWALDPDIQIVICTAYSDYSWEETVNQLGQKENLLILKKPFDSVAVRQLACALTKKWQLVKDVKNYTSKLEEEIKERTLSLQESFSLVKATFESSNDGILVINNQDTIIDYNQKFIKMWNVPEEITGQKNATKLFEYMKSQLKNPETLVRNYMETDSDFDSVKIDLLRFGDGTIIEYYTQPQKVDEKIIGHVFDFRDITKQIKLEKNLEYQATHDALTGLPNRILLLDKIKQAVYDSKKYQTLFALLFLDLDRFKLINDSLSHAVGDEILKMTAERLQSIIRVEDTIARLGGDEFVIIFDKIKNEKDIFAKLANIQKAFCDPFEIEDRKITVNVSVGISIYPKNGESPDILLRNADAAMYQAKKLRGTSSEFYSDELNKKSLLKLNEEIELRAALSKNEFFICYQPQIDTKNVKVIAAEALIRWNHPQKGVLLPIDFLELAEETGLIIPIGEWVLRNACMQNKKWQDMGLPHIRMAVNITAEQFSHQDIVSLVNEVLEETKLAPQYLELELTENVVVSNPEIIKSIQKLKDLGASIAIDDFGTGYSNLSYLEKIPLDRLKIDSSFIKHIQSPTDDDVIIRAIIAMAKNLNLEILAEGVETQNQLNFLKQHECEDIQGFYFSKPLKAEEFEILLKDMTKNKVVE